MKYQMHGTSEMALIIYIVWQYDKIPSYEINEIL